MNSEDWLRHSACPICGETSCYRSHRYQEDWLHRWLPPDPEPARPIRWSGILAILLAIAAYITFGLVIWATAILIHRI